MTAENKLAVSERDLSKEVIFPPTDLDQLLNLARFVQGHTEPGLLLGPDGEQVPLPLAVYEVLRQVVEMMRQGKAIVVDSKRPHLTTQEAADFIGVSRPTLVKLLENNSIPFEKPNRHRRVRLLDLVAFQERRGRERRNILNGLTGEASSEGLYDGTLDDYSKALRSARKGHPDQPTKK